MIDPYGNPVPEDTRRRDPLTHLAGSMGRGGFGQYVEEQEKAGQSQVVHSDVIPRKGTGGVPYGFGDESQADWEALGFVFGEDVDDLFRRVTLPDGWKREGSEHAMWSYLLDERGVRRASIFYKAAFYDRDAHVSLSRPGRAATTDTIYGDAPVALPPLWDVFTEQEREDYAEALRAYIAEDERRTYADEHGYGDRARQALALVEASRG